MRAGRLAAILAAALLGGCGAGGAASPPLAPPTTPSASRAVDVTIFAAASLSGVLDKAKAAYETAHPGTILTIATDSSSALETQIEQGAPADLFLAADTANPTKLLDAGLAAGEPVAFAGNLLTVVVPADNPAGITTPADLGRKGVKVVAAGDDVPISRYATQLLENLSKESGYPADFEAAVTANVVSKEDNVKTVIAKIELGEGDAGIVYVTDAKVVTDVKTVDIPDRANVPAKYSGVVIQASTHREAAQTFLGWLTGPGGQAILSSFGFVRPFS